MKEHNLTAKETQILAFIRARMEEKGTPPTLREIMEFFSYRAIGTVQDHMASLQRKGVLFREKGKARSIRLKTNLPRNFPQTVSVPVLGKIAAGYPVFSEENVMGYVPVFTSETKGDKLFAVTVSGESMIEAGIFDGDTAILEQTETAQEGEIVAVWVDGETTLKEFHRTKGGKISLVPRNNSMDPIEYSEGQVSEIRILGRMKGLYRKYSG